MINKYVLPPTYCLHVSWIPDTQPTIAVAAFGRREDSHFCGLTAESNTIPYPRYLPYFKAAILPYAQEPPPATCPHRH